MEKFVVQTNYGPIRGCHKTSQLNDDYFAYQGIPFAKPPIGELRFKAPEPCEPWKDILDATKEKPIPFPADRSTVMHDNSEDCLYLNIYKKDIDSKDKFPVLVFIYGGAFHSGSSTSKFYGPEFLMQKNVILVTFNYRVGALGFLNFKDPALDIPGNAGLKDQLLALKWIKENIQYFGGDSENITLFGCSAGAVSIGCHLIYEKSKGLFNKAILMTGSPFYNYCFLPPNDLSERLAKETGWDGKDGETGALTYLRTVNPEFMMHVSNQIISPEDMANDIYFSFAPIVEHYKSDSCFIEKHPIEAMKNAWSKDMDIIIGHTNNEGITFIQRATHPGFMNGGAPELIVPFRARDGKPKETWLEYKEGISDLYGLSKMSETNLEPFFEFIKDKMFVHGNHHFITSRVGDAETKGKTFAYRFCYDYPERNHHKIKNNVKHLKGACHGDDLSYVFSMHEYGPLPVEYTDEWVAIQKVRDMYVDFATKGSSALDEYGWECINKNDLPYEYKCMEISEDWKMTKAPELSRMQTWDSMFK